MLDLFRKRGAMSVVYTGIMGAILIVFVIQFRPGSDSPMGSIARKCVAKVRGTCIDEKDWRAQRWLLRGASESSASLNFNKAALDSLIERTLLKQEAARLGVRVSEDDVMHELIRDKVYVTVPVAMRAQARQLGINDLGFRWTQFGTKDKPFDQQTFDRVVRQTTGQNTTEFIDSQEEELLAARVLSLVMQRVRVGDSEAWEEYSKEKSTSAIEYIRFSPVYFSQHFVPQDAASIEKWANEHAKEVDDRAATMPKETEPHLYHPRHILIEVKKDAPPEKKAEAKAKAEEILAWIKNGEDFAKLAKDYSNDPGSKDKGGEYDWTTGEEYVPEFREGLAKLKHGETSLVETQFGFHVLQVLARYDGRVAVAQPLYMAARGADLARTAAETTAAALKGRVPVVLDDELRQKVEEAKKGGKSDAEATAQVLEDETRARVTKAVDATLTAIAAANETHDKKTPAAPAPKTRGKDTLQPPSPSPPAWETDDRRPRAQDSGPFNSSGSPIAGIEEQQPILEAAEKLTKEAPFAGPIKAGSDLYLLLFRDRHPATRPEFEKDRPGFVGNILAKKRDDAAVNYVTALRDGLGKDLTIESRYASDDKKPASGSEGPVPLEEE